VRYLPKRVEKVAITWNQSHNEIKYLVYQCVAKLFMVTW